jgi:two-component system NtrC family sensor kinase
MTEGLIRSTLGSNTSLTFSVDEDTDLITVDLAELELALINTALNAHHAMPGGGALRICAVNTAPTTDGQPMVVVTIEDSGRGIAPDLLGKVFEPFFSTKGEGKGSGLGLSQVRGLCEQAGGFATIESEVGVGTKVSMYFPAIDVIGTSIASSLPHEEDIALEGRVLLVEDNDEVASVTEQLLRSSGLMVVRAVNADAALTQLGLQSADLDMILSDISMPGSMDGVQLAFLVRQRWPHVPILLMTGFAERINDAIRAQMPVLAKPVHPLELLREVGKLLGKREARATQL